MNLKMKFGLQKTGMIQALLAQKVLKKEKRAKLRNDNCFELYIYPLVSSQIIKQSKTKTYSSNNKTTIMRNAIIALLVLCAFASLGSAVGLKKSHYNATVHAETASKGGFIGTCKSLSVSNTILKAQCGNRNGVWISTSLDLNTCFQNFNGLFSCGGGYAATGRDASVSGTVLTGTLAKRNGKWKTAQIDLNNFITNVNGELVCDCHDDS